MKVFNTGETDAELKEKYNPEGSVLRKAQLRMLDMLLYIDKVCKEQNIPYRLDGGNVLGALRHGGFIPWDDDVDIVLEEKDFNRLCDYLKKNPHPQYVLQDHSTDENYLQFFAVLRDMKSEYVQDSYLHSIRKYKGLQVDIFPFTSGIVPFWYILVKKMYGFQNLCLRHRFKIMAKILYNINKLILIPTGNLISFFGGAKDKYMHSYGHAHICRFDKTILLPHKDIMFEGHVFPGPAQPEEFCKQLYGDYLNLPPIDKRNHHEANYKIWN